MSDEIESGYLLVWHEPRKIQQQEQFDTMAQARQRIDAIRGIAREWDLYSGGVLIDNGFYER